MNPALIAIPFLALLVWVFVIGLKAARTRKLSMFGLVPAGCAMGAFAWSAFVPSVEYVPRAAAGLAAIAAGLAHGVWFSLVALPAQKVWLRLVLVPIGMWCGTFTSLWFLLPNERFTVKVLVAVLGSATLTAWIMLPFLSREKGYVKSGSRMIPSVRFPCPRCGTRVDWGQGIAACTDCGLFLHIYWPADENATPAGTEDPTTAPRSVRFACPSCGVASEWPRGDGACEHCGLKLSLHWNVHPQHRAASRQGPKS
jgi:endogenous inhibitor of DNA gyrase (YacG/DUF329 family)